MKARVGNILFLFDQSEVQIERQLIVHTRILLFIMNESEGQHGDGLITTGKSQLVF
jgi:hypothetical protein